MKKRIFNGIFWVSFGLILFLFAIVTLTLFNDTNETSKERLHDDVTLVAAGVNSEGVSYLEGLELVDDRITLINTDGTVLYDSMSTTSEMENHLEREEVQEAIESGYGESSRYSSTILEYSNYIAIKLDDGTILRLSNTQKSIFYLFIKLAYPLIFVIILAAGIALVLSFTISNKIVEPLNHLDLDHPLESKHYDELEPILEKIDYQQKQIKSHAEEMNKASLIRQEFTANASHELKTPLQVISGYAELLKDGVAKPEDEKEFETKIYDESQRMTKLVSDIIELTKLDEGNKEAEKTDVDLYSVANDVKSDLDPVAQEKKVNISLTGTSTIINANAQVIHSVIYNLVDNGIKYNKEGGKVDIVIENSSGKRKEKRVIVSDNGIGIPQESLERIFERFYRVEKSRSKALGGTGLGLSIVKHGVEVSGGHIHVNSTLGEGTVFTIIF